MLLMGRLFIRTDPCKSSARFASCPCRPRPRRMSAQHAMRICSGTDPALGLRPRHPPAPRVSTRSCASCHGCAPSACLCPCRGSCRQRAPHLPPQRHSVASSSASASSCVDEPPFVQAASRCYAESACCNSMFQVFQMFQRYVVSVLCGCCKSRSGYCICCNGYTRMLQAYVLNVSSVFRRTLQVCLSG